MALHWNIGGGVPYQQLLARGEVREGRQRGKKTNRKRGGGQGGGQEER